MKKLFLAVCALSLSFFACKKDDGPVKPATPGGKKVALNIHTNDFLQKLESIPGANNKIAGTAGALRDSALAAKVSDLYYLLYDGSGNRLKLMHQSASVTEDFGSFYDTAAPGSYTIVLLASQAPLDVSYTDQLSGSAFSIPMATWGEIENMPDIFYTKESVYITDASDAIELNMNLSRVVGNLQINILDMPQPGSGDTSVSIKITPEAFTFFLDQGTTSIGIADIINAKVNRISLNTFSSYVLNTVSPFTVTISYVDPATGQPQTKVINNVQCYMNRKTILSGYLYGGSAPENSGVKVVLLDSWSSDDNQIQF
jgi:hypothetical protein